LLARALVHHEEHVPSQQPYVAVGCHADKAHSLPLEETTVGDDDITDLSGRIILINSMREW